MGLIVREYSKKPTQIFYYTGPSHVTIGAVPKYSRTISSNADKMIPQSLPESSRELIFASLSRSSWNKNATALNKFKRFESFKGKSFIWPLSREAICQYVDWCLNKEKLSPATVEAYLSALSFVHKVNSMSENNCFNFVTKTMLTGAENMKFYSEISGQARKVMTLPVLKILGHQIAVSDWSEDSKQVFWCAALFAFFGSFRMGEILCQDSTKFHPDENLLWKDVKIKIDSVTVKVKIPKNRKPTGEYIDLFEYKDSGYCPISAIKKLEILKGRGKKDETPIFGFSSGILLTQSVFNSLLSSLLRPVLGEAADGFSGHSFRAAIPSALANCPHIANNEDIKSWGRWDSPSFKRYTRLSPKQKKGIFEKIVVALESL